ncbi:MAG: hypothetical protein EOP48_04375 [Sphingobacteriales bacterium]|nr:MAG: hypothetical protein EOP48_04375 [Sphingobacteriales bacterium]
MRQRSFINLSIAIVQLIALCTFSWFDTLQVDKVYNAKNSKHNLYSSLTGWYKKAYFKPHQGELGGDGEFWETKVPYYFPFFEIEISRDQCHEIHRDSSYASFNRHLPE